MMASGGSAKLTRIGCTWIAIIYEWGAKRPSCRNQFIGIEENTCEAMKSFSSYMKLLTIPDDSAKMISPTLRKVFTN